MVPPVAHSAAASPFRSLPVWVAAAAGTGILAAVAPQWFLPVLGVALAASLLLVQPIAALGMLVASRSSLDRFAYESFDVPAFLVNPAASLGLGILALALVLLVLRARGGVPIDWGGQPSFLWAGWLAVCGFGILIGYLQHGAAGASLGIREWLRLATFLALYLLTVNLADLAWKRRFLVTMILVGLAVPAVVGFYQLLTGDTYHDIYGIRRISGTFVHPNPFGLYLATMTTVLLGLLRDVQGIRQRLLVIAVLGLAVTLLVFTYSRSALAVLLAAVLGLALTGSAKQRLLVLTGLALAAIPTAPLLAWRFMDLFTASAMTPETNSLAWRLLNYRRLLDAFAESPLVGHGLKTISLANPTKSVSLEGHTIGFASHNELLRVLVEQGLVGLVAYVVLVVGMLRVLRTFRDAQPPAAEGGLPGTANAVFCLVAVLFLLSALGTEFFSHTVVLYVLFTLLGVFHAGRRAEARV